MDSARVSITAEMPIGTRQNITRDVAHRIAEEFKAKYPEIKVLNYSFGQADSDNTFANMSENGTYIMSYNISLVSIEKRDRHMTEIADLMRKDKHQPGRLYPGDTD